MDDPRILSIVSKIKTYFELFENKDFHALKNMALDNQIDINSKKLYSNNIENIESGVSGYLIFLLEFYKFENNELHLSTIKNIAFDLIEYCKENKTVDYSLYRGRGGVIYLLLQLYKIDKNPAWINLCCELILPCGNEYLESDHTSDYLYNGRAGTLLLLVEIYQINNSAEILLLINAFCLRILLNAELTEKGASWKAVEELNLENSCGFAYGTSGILYVLTIVNECFPTEAIDYIINDSKIYINNCWMDEHKNWANFEKDILTSKTFKYYNEQFKITEESLFLPTFNLGWANGKAGISIIIGGYPQIDINEIAQHGLSNNIYDGLSGVGLVLLKNSKANNEVITSIIDRLLNESNQAVLDGGLMFGSLGNIYFLLKFISNDNNTISRPGEFLINRFSTLNIDNALVKKNNLKKFYRRTLFFLDALSSKPLNEFLSLSRLKDTDTELKSFEKFISSELETKSKLPAHSLLKDVYLLEKGKKNYYESDPRTNLEIYLDRINHGQKIIKLLNRPDEWILNQPIEISESIKIIFSQWDWVLRDNYSFIENFYNEPAQYGYLFFRSLDRVSEYSLKIDGLVLQRFDGKNTISQAILEIKQFCQSQSLEMIEAFSTDTGSQSVKDFISRLDFLVYHKVKQLLYDGILKFEKC